MNVQIPPFPSIEPQGQPSSIKQGKNSLGQVDHALSQKMSKVKTDLLAYNKLELLKTNLQLLREKYPEMEKQNGCALFAHELKQLVDSVKPDLSNLDENVQKFCEAFAKYNVDLTAIAIAKIASGKVKSVFFEPVTRHVLYTARPGKGPFARIIRALHEVELRKEVGFVSEIKKSLAKLAGIGQNLVLEYDESSQKIGGKYTVQTEKASFDFEHQIRSHVPFPQSSFLSLDYLRGVRDLHAASYVQGDMKPENALVFSKNGKRQLKLSDFGKARRMGADGHGTHTGNARFSPPEGFLSQKGEVFGAALVIIRSLEEEVLEPQNNDMMLSIDKYKDRSPQSEKRRGIEKFVVQNAECLQTESTHMRGKFRMLSQRGQALVSSVSQEKVEATSAQVSKYIDALMDRLEKKHPANTIQLIQLRILLKNMVDANPAVRPDAKTAVERMEAILSPIGKE